VKTFLPLTVLVFLCAGVVQPQEISLLWNSRPPYMSRAGDSIEGLTASVVIEALESAGLSYEVQEVPSNRQIADIQANRKPLAALGWFKNPERESFARFSVPVYQDNPFVVVSRKDNMAVSRMTTLDELFADRNLDLLVKDGYSYGVYIDRKIQECNPSRVVITSESVSSIKMINAGRGDYMFMASEETAVLIVAAGLDPSNFSMTVLTDLPIGEYRYLMFSKSVSDGIIDRLNAGIEAALAARGRTIR